MFLRNMLHLPISTNHYLPTARKSKHCFGICLQQFYKLAQTVRFCEPIVAKHNFNVLPLCHLNRFIPIENMTIGFLIMNIMNMRILCNKLFYRIVGRIVRNIDLIIFVLLHRNRLQQPLYFLCIIIRRNTNGNFWIRLHC